MVRQEEEGEGIGRGGRRRWCREMRKERVYGKKEEGDDVRREGGRRRWCRERKRKEK